MFKFAGFKRVSSTYQTGTTDTPSYAGLKLFSFFFKHIFTNSLDTD